MEFELHSHRFGRSLLLEPGIKEEWEELASSLHSITDVDIQSAHERKFAKNKSISKAINFLIHDRLVALGWAPEARIFQDENYTNKIWRLDFAKDNISVEVAFNHGEAIAWNLLKPVLASELNHVQKQSNTRLGVMVMANEAMKMAGGFDNAVGTYEKAIRYLKPLQNQLSCPIVLVGLQPPASFRVEHRGKPKRAFFVPS